MSAEAHSASCSVSSPAVSWRRSLSCLIIITATFFMIRFVPGGPFTAEKAVTPEILRNLEAHYGLDQAALAAIPRLPRQPRCAATSARRSSIPTAPSTRSSPTSSPSPLELGAISLAVALLLGIGLGILAAVRSATRGSTTFASAFGMIGICVPTFVLGPLLVLGLAIHLGWFNASGWYGPADRVLPALTSASFTPPTSPASPAAACSRCSTRISSAPPAPRAPRSSASSSATPLRGGLLPVVSFLGPAIAGILTGSFVIETIFQIPGIGREFVNSAFNRDYTLVLGTVILYAVAHHRAQPARRHRPGWLNPKVRNSNPEPPWSPPPSPARRRAHARRQLEKGTSLWTTPGTACARTTARALRRHPRSSSSRSLCVSARFFAQSYQEQNLDLGATAPSRSTLARHRHARPRSLRPHPLRRPHLHHGRPRRHASSPSPSASSYGAVAGFFGGKIDSVMMRIVDIMYALPFTIFVILLMVFFGRNIVLLFVAIGAVEWLTMARIVRGQIMSIKRMEYIEAARSLGLGKRRIIFRHMIPNVLGPIIVYTTLTIPASCCWRPSSVSSASACSRP
jgi:oligopeptide transport system permease protein